MISASEVIEEESVLCGSSALVFSGLIIFSNKFCALQTDKEELDRSNFYFITFHYNPCIDYDYRVQPSKSNSMLLKPTKERALVECILHLDWIDEGLLIEGIKNYIEQFWDEKELYTVADYFGLDHDTLEYWLNEARNDCEV